MFVNHFSLCYVCPLFIIVNSLRANLNMRGFLSDKGCLFLPFDIYIIP